MEHQTPSGFPGNFRKRKVLGTLWFPSGLPETLGKAKARLGRTGHQRVMGGRWTDDDGTRERHTDTHTQRGQRISTSRTSREHREKENGKPSVPTGVLTLCRKEWRKQW